MSIEIRRVHSKKDLKKFINLPYEMYKGHARWVPPMRMDEADTHNRKKNPAFEKVDAEYWLAYKNGELVGRVVGIQVHAEVEESQIARFGWIDFVDDREVSRALIETVETWAKEAGLKGVHGPMGYCDMDPNGMQVDGFDEYATMATIYHPEYAHRHLLELGYSPSAEWLEFEGNLNIEFSERDHQRTQFVKDRFGLTVVDIKKQKDIVPYTRDIFYLINKTYVDLYGFYPLSEKQITHYIDKYLKLVRKDYICLILKDKNLVGFGIGMPSFSEVLREIDGKMLPFGWMKMLNAFRKDEYIDLYLVSADPEYAKLGVTRLVVFEIFKNLKRNRVKKIYMNPILKENIASRGMWASPLATEGDIRVRKRRQVFLKHF